MNIVPEDKVKGVLITKTAIKLLASEEVIEKVINFQFKDANAALRGNHEVEISGLGKLMISKSKLRRYILKMKNSVAKFEKDLLDPNIPEGLAENKRARLENCKNALIFLEEKNKRYED